MSKMIKRLFSLLAVFTLILTNSLIVHADVPDLNRKGSVSISLTDKETGESINGAEIRLYRAAKTEWNGHEYIFTPVDGFEGFDISGYKIDDAALPAALKEYAAAHDSSYVSEESADGTVFFDEVSTGLYLALQVNEVEGYYQIDPFVFTLPMKDPETDSWIFDITALPKPQETEPDNPPKPQYIDITVTKVWELVNNRGKLPDSIKVELICDNTVYDTVSVKKSEDWTYSWKNLPADHTYSVRENPVPTDFKVSYTQNGYSFTIKNSQKSEEQILGIQANQFTLAVISLGVVLVLVFLIFYLSKKRRSEE